MPQRLKQIKHWLDTALSIQDYDIAPASSDASFRRYFRITRRSGQFDHYQAANLIVMDAPPEKENIEPFIRIAKLFGSAGLNVPGVLAENREQGFLLLSDLGSTQYLSILNDSNVESLYADAVSALFTLQSKIGVEDAGFPAYDRALLARELEIFREWYLQKHLGLRLSSEQNSIIDDAFEVLIVSALEQPVVCVHRDFHSRNLMQTHDNNPGILDFQDAVVGPITYDLVSLLKDCYVKWPAGQVQNWALSHKQRLMTAGILENIGDSDFLRWFDLMGAQRHLKATGIFARLEHRDGKSNYLDDIPRTMSYVMDVSNRYSELHALNRFMISMLPSLAS